jgi:hypothetical protein
VLGLIGAKDCGKSLVIEHLISPALGGKMADANAFLLDKTQFNGDLFQSELLVISDKGLGESYKDREILRDNLKRAVAETGQAMRCLYKEQITVRPIWRIVLAANDSAENITDIPTIDASFADKIIYLKCFPPAVPFYCESKDGAREAFARAIAQELPAFLHHVDSYQIPQELVKGRFGIREWHHPQILDSLETASPLQPIIEVIHEWIKERFDDNENSKTITSKGLYDELSKRNNGKALQGICGSPHVLGRQLSSISESPSWSELVSRETRRINGSNRQKQTVWTITKPDGEEFAHTSRHNIFSAVRA